MVNKWIGIGRLTKAVDNRNTQSGEIVANFTIACNEKWTDKSTGEKKERVEFVRIVAFKRLGEICGEYLSKGSQVYVEGRLQTKSWEKGGATRYSTEIIASTVQFLGGKDSASSSGDDSKSQPDTQKQKSEPDVMKDIPF